MAILRRLAKGITEVGEKFSSMNAVFLSEEETIRITNEEFETVKREDLSGNFDFSVDISTAEVDNMKAQDLAFMLQTMGPNMDLGMTIMILAEIADLKRMPDLAERIRRYQPTPDPLEEEKKKLEIEKLRLEVRKLQSEADLNDAKAEEARAKADQAALDFVEQETGTKHARDLEKQQAQSDGNKELQITKALTSKKKEGEVDPDITAAIGYNELTKNKGEFGVTPVPIPVDNGLNSDDLTLVDPTLVP
jgi:DNA-binding transcriptional regulator GbsR (MarR family)